MQMINKEKILILIFIIIIGGSAVFGQTYRTFNWEMEQVAENARFRLGPFRIWPGFNLTNVGYDGNVYYTTAGEAEVTDYTATISPLIRAYLLVRHSLILSLTENPAYVYYFTEERERRWNNTFSPQFKYLFMHRFVITGRYTNRDRRIRASSEFDARINELRKEYFGSIFLETARETSLGLSYGVTEFKYEDIKLPEQEISFARALNRREKNISGEFYYKILTDIFFFLRGGYSDYKFLHPDTQFRNSYSYQGYAGIRFPLLGRTSGTFELGYKTLTPRIQGMEKFAGLVGNTSLNYRLGRFILRMQYSRDSRFSFWHNNVYYTYNNITSGLSYYLIRPLRIDYSYSYGLGLYPGLLPVQQPDGSVLEIERKDKYHTHTLGLVFRIVRNTGIGINMTQWSRDSNFYFAERGRLFVGAYLTYDF